MACFLHHLWGKFDYFSSYFTSNGHRNPTDPGFNPAPEICVLWPERNGGEEVLLASAGPYIGN